MASQFQIQSVEFHARLDPDMKEGFTVKSCPRPYQLEFVTSEVPGLKLAPLIAVENHPLILADRKVRELHLNEISAIDSVPCYLVDATEANKCIEQALDIIEFLELHQATRTSRLFVIGGGIVQDLGAFAAATFKRGIPWTFVPTTLLAQGDSCVGGKTALNHKQTKNLLALFSAPRQVQIDTGFLTTLNSADRLSGAGEIFRLAITGGADFVSLFERDLPDFLAGSSVPTARMIANALSVKRAVVEEDEFEIDLRRSMNYGHSIGHAMEALTAYQIPHGTAVAFGILVENEISFRRGMLSAEEKERLLGLGLHIIPPSTRTVLRQLRLDSILDLLMRDKKTEGTKLVLAILETIGSMRFIPLELDHTGKRELDAAYHAVVERL